MNKVLVEKIKESVQAVLPLTVVVFIVLIALKAEMSVILSFALGAVMLIVGLVIFGLGANESMMFIADETGAYITKRRKIWLLVLVGLTVGFLITLSEPGIWVLGEQFSSTIPKYTLIIAVAIGVASFIVIALLRIVFQIRLNLIVIILFTIVFGLIIFVDSSFIPVAFDSGGLSSGPMAVPFIVALGLGISSGRGSRNEEDSFGMLGINSIGPVIAILILGMFYKPEFKMSEEGSATLLNYIVQYLGEIGIAIVLFIIFFAVFQIFAFKFSKKRVIRVMIGFLLTYVGLVIFLSGANVGFLSVAKLLGEKIAGFENQWLLIPFGLLFGFVIVSAEPSVIVLVNQVQEVTDGRINRKIMIPALSIGVSLAIGLSMARIVYDISVLYILIPGYLIAIILTFFVPKIFTAIAFDSGAAVSGALTSTFLVPFALGAANIVYANDPTGKSILNNAFGLVAFVLLAPLVTIQVLGLIFKLKSKKAAVITDTSEDEIIEIDEV